ncbi:MAG: carbon-nitrogen hydrolase family protein [Nitrospinae bacterium]|nr:carbon-nitrogen hydrolase family protein [Nitrospinota bacterium]
MIVAAAQMVAGTDIGSALGRAETIICQAAGDGARLVALPEYFAWYGPEDRMAAAANRGADILAAMGKAATRCGVYVLAGSVLMPGSEGKVRNVSTLFAPDGSMVSEYQKMKMFDAQTAVRAYHESDFLEPGQNAVTTQLDEWTLGLAICFELRFPALFLKLREMGANLIAVPSAFTHETGKDHWSTLVKCRAMDTQSYMIAPALTGESSGGKKCFGHTMIVGPWGEVMASRDEGEGYVVADISLERVEEVRDRMKLG